VKSCLLYPENRNVGYTRSTNIHPESASVFNYHKSLHFGIICILIFKWSNGKFKEGKGGKLLAY